MTQTLTPEIITAAIEGLTARQESIGRQITELRAMLPGSRSDSNRAPSEQRGRSRLSPEARERIAEAQRRRWAAARGESQPAASAPAKAPKKRRLSSEGRRHIQEALRKRWAAKRAEAAQPPPAKKATGRKAAAKAGKRGPAKK